MRIYHWISTVVLLLFLFHNLGPCEASAENNTNVLPIDGDTLNYGLNARVIFNRGRGSESYQSRKSKIWDLLEEDEEDEEDEEENEGSSYYVDQPTSSGDENVTAIESSSPKNKSKIVASIDTFLPTADGVDPDDPEEIARKKHYESRLDIFDQIVAINKKTNKTARLEEGDVRHSGPNPFRNAGGGALWTKKSYGQKKGLVFIPYVLSPQYNSTHIAIIKSAMKSYAKHTCIRFVKRRSERSYLSIRDQGGCWAYVGKTGYSAQTVSLGIPGCVTKGIALHELMHAVGFQHEHSRNDRDNYVKIVRNNIQRGMEDNFDKHTFTRNLVLYDYGSVMHYSQHAFSKQPYLPSIEIYPKRKPEPRVGQRTRLSPYDIEEIKYLYNCSPKSYKRCGKDFVNQERGSFQSPLYPNAYPKESHCTWKITVRPGRFIKLTFQNVEIFDSSLCENDAILIHDGKNASAPVLKKICGTHSSDVEVTSTSSHVYVIFSSDVNQNSNHGFRAIFRETSRQGRRIPPINVPTLAPITSTVQRLSCNFESGLCGMTQDNLDDLNYLFQRGSTPSRDTGPDGDRTTGRGRYIYVESSLPAEVGNNAIIRSPWFDRTNIFCVIFSYHMFGSYMGGLRLYAFEKKSNSNQGYDELLWEIHGNQGRKWNTKRVTYRPRRNVQNVQFYWESYIYYYQSDIALDDISVVPGDCSSVQLSTTTSPAIVVWTPNRRTFTRKATTIAPRLTTILPPTNRVYSSVNCSFDNDLCEFFQSTSDNFDWTRNRGHTPSASTGPSQDHTSGSGSYLFIEASSPRRLGHTARLQSPALTPDRHCLHLWYHMYGKQTGKLSIWQMINGVSTLLVEKVGDSGNQWIPLSVDINSPNFKKSERRRDFNNNLHLRPRIDENEEIEPEVDVENETNLIQASRDEANSKRTPNQNNFSNDLQVFIDASVGRGYAGDIAIDDIEITDAPCQQQVVRPTSSVLLDGFSCDFENQQQYCGFIQSQEDDFDWVLNSGHTGSSGTGPGIDHTKKTNQGVYIYTESSSPRHINDVTELISPLLIPKPYCIRFAYHMHGSATGEINIFSREKLQGRTFLNPARLWGEAGPQGDNWFTAAVDFSPSPDSQAVQIIFQGIIGTSFTSDMALDDILIASGPCSPSTRAQTTATNPISVTTRQPTTTTTPPRTTTTIQPTTTTTARTTQPTSTTSKKPETTIQPTTTTTTQPTTTTTTTTTQPTTTTTTTTTQPTTTTTTTTTQPITTTTTTITTQPTTTTTTTTISQTTLPTTTARATTTFSPHPQEFSCDFESLSLCDLRQSTDDAFDWITRRFRTPSKKTGPTQDHTISSNGRGKYLYIEASSPRRKNDVAIISTPKLAVRTPKRCLIFWYNMWGKGIGALNVFANFQSGLRSPANRLIFSETGNQGQSWKMAKVEIKQQRRLQGGSMQVSFQGVRGKSYLSDIAIDDICIAEGPCDAASRCNDNGVLRSTRSRSAVVRKVASIQSTAATKITAAQSTTTTLRTPMTGGPTLWSGMPLCTFEKPTKKARKTVSRAPAIPGTSTQDLGPYNYPDNIINNKMCGWKQTGGKRDQFDWSMNRGSTLSQRTGPDGDKTTGNGYYMYIESSAPRKENDAAYLYTYPMPPSDYCIDLYYHMKGLFIGRLSVRSLQKLTDGRTITTLLSNVIGEQGSTWKNLKVDYSPRTETQFVAFRLDGKVGKDYRGDIAVDDITILPGKCNACRNPSHRYVNSLNQQQKFSTGCVDTSLFWVRCCSITRGKVVYRRVTQCNPNMFTAERLNWYCSNM